MRTKETPTNFEILELFKMRWATRAFDITKPVEREKLLSMCEAARWVPTCYNEQPYKFMIFNIFTNEEAYNKAFDCLVEWNKNWAKSAPILVAAIANTKSKKNGKFNRWAEYDTGTATMAFYTQAISLGVMTHAMGGFDAEKLKSAFGISDDFVPMSMIAVGYQSDDINVIDETYHKGEIEPRVRLDMNENFYENAWENGIM